MNKVLKFYSKIRYSMYALIFIISFYLVLSFSLKLFLSKNTFATYIDISANILILIISLLMLGLMLAPCYITSSNYLNEGSAWIIDFDIEAFDIDNHNTYKTKDTYTKLKHIKQNILQLTKEEKYLILNYFEAKNNTPFPFLVSVLATFILGILGTLMKEYFKGASMVILLYLFILIFGAPAINWLLGNRRRKLTEAFIISLIKNSFLD
ncbi:hypothetical protein PJZ01_001036 [Listeria innocua]|nr:hypothetical protein [Listeria innocua]EKJ8909997.1 hypothetical protein [Listeria innocua]EKJ8914577.1 hypothetical protein [Listeria innocua]EKJ8928836.1 hypothetical protein [Listeria innocua]EKJ8949201.1 hypothetical protein [Listeria innocua]